MERLGVIFTVGYGERDRESLLRALRKEGVQILIDVRSAPYSRHRPEFSKEPLRRAARAAGLRYWYRGRFLGGRPRDPSFYRGGKLDVAAQRASPGYQADLRRVACAAAMGARLCLLCAEADPRRCHRALILGHDLHRRGGDVRHLLGDGRVVAHGALFGVGHEQLALFSGARDR